MTGIAMIARGQKREPTERIKKLELEAYDAASEIFLTALLDVFKKENSGKSSVVIRLHGRKGLGIEYWTVGPDEVDGDDSETGGRDVSNDGC
jgi:hypothetical protein